MTLSTHIRIIEPTPVRPLFDECRRLLRAEEAEFEDGLQKWGPCNRRLENKLGQGFPAWLVVTYGADGPLLEYEDVVNDPALTDQDHVYYPGPASIDVMFDTAYGYKGLNGASCSDLHAYLVVHLGWWLSGQGLTWYWQNEFTGEWHCGMGGRDAILELGDPIKGLLPLYA
jgi:hypothetical protein